MAKSLRASNKVKARNARRYTPNTDYAITQAARLNAIAQRLAERVKGPTVFEEEQRAARSDDAEGEKRIEGKADKDGANGRELEAMEVETHKISTSGPRNARRETWRKAKGWKPKQGSKNGGKPKRRR